MGRQPVSQLPPRKLDAVHLLTSILKSKIFLILICIVILSVLGVMTWRNWPRYLLKSAANQIDAAYNKDRPFHYRWIGAPYSTEKDDFNKPCNPVPDALLNNISLQMHRAQHVMGETAQWLQLAGRIDLLHCHPHNAISKYKLALLLEPGDSSLQLELGIAYALQVEAEKRDLDYEFALEYVLDSLRTKRTPEALFNSALLFEEIGMPLQACDRWKEAGAADTSIDWQIEAGKHSKRLEAMLANRKQKIEELTASPESYMIHAAEAAGSIEVVIGTALKSWLPLALSSNVHRQALEHLAQELKDRHHDIWFSELLQVLSSSRMQRTAAKPLLALHALSDAWNSNSHGEHEQAEKTAEEATGMFRKLGNKAGELRSELELVYSFQRRGLSNNCLDALKGIRESAQKHHYVWIAGQAELDRITCLTQTRKTDVITPREQAYSQISDTGYEGLRLRALGFLTDSCVCFGSRLRIWQRGRAGALNFWHQYLPEIRGFAFYANLGYSAHTAGNREAAIALMQETTRILEKSENQLIRARFLTELAAWEMEANLNHDALVHLNEAALIFKESATIGIETYQRESEILRAEAETSIGHPLVALERLQRLTATHKFPYTELPYTERRRLLPAMGDAFSALNRSEDARKSYEAIIQETRDDVKLVQDCSQRDNALREIESAWRGLTAIDLEKNEIEKAATVWESFRGGRFGDISDSPIYTPRGISLLIYAFLPHDRLSGWVINEHGTIAQKWLDAQNAKRVAAEFSGLASNLQAPPESVKASAQTLYNLLIAPFLKDLPKDSFLVIDADGPFGSIPWAALEDTNGEALIEQYSLTQAAGWAEVKRTAYEESVDTSNALILSSPAIGSELAAEYPPLPSAWKEAEILQHRLPNSKFIAGSAVTLEAIEKYAPGSKLLHFAGHGVSYGGFGALVLAPSLNEKLPAQLMTADKIAAINLQGMQMAVLSACSAGAGEQSGAVNLDSLVRGFLNAGTVRVVASRWDIPDRETSLLMRKFYELILNKKRPAEALRQAMILIRKNPKTSHPYNWASFQIFGTP